MTDQDQAKQEIKRGPGRPPKALAAEVDDVKETVSMFLDKIAVAKAEGAESIETTDEIIAHYNRTGLNGAKFFIYNGIKVYPLGKTEEIEAECDADLGKKIHGAGEGNVV